VDKKGGGMTCAQAAQLLYWYSKKEAVSKEEYLLQDLFGGSRQGREFLSKLQLRFEAGDLDLSYGEIPSEFMEALASILQKEPMPIAC